MSLDVPLRPRQFAGQRLGPFVLLLQRLSQLRRRTLGGFEFLSCAASSPALLDSASCVSVSRRALASSLASASALSCSFCSDCRSSAVALSAAFLSCAASSPALLDSANCVSMSRRALASSLGQGLGPVALLLQRLSQLHRRTLGGLLELRRLVARLA